MNYKIEFFQDAKGVGIASAIVKPKGERIELFKRDWIDIEVPKDLHSGYAPEIQPPLPTRVAGYQPSQSENEIDTWRPIASALVLGELVRRFDLRSNSTPEARPVQTSVVSVPAFESVRRAIDAVGTFHEVINAIAPAMTWSVGSGVQWENAGDTSGKLVTPLPPIDLLPQIADAALKINDGTGKLVALAVVHAIGQEAMFLAEGFGEVDEESWSQSPERRRHWFQVLKHWLEYLHQRCSELVRVRVAVHQDPNNPRKEWRSSWLPVTTVRTVSLQLKLNLASKWRDDFVSRVGMESPWDNGSLWAVKSMPMRDNVYCDPWPCPLDHLHWWQNCLTELANKLIATALKDPTHDGWSSIETEVPWFRQSMASTVALAHSMGQLVGRKMLTEAAKAGPEIAAAPNTLIADEARLINKPSVIDHGEIWKLADDPSLLADERVSAPVRAEKKDENGTVIVEGIRYQGSMERLITPVQNLADNVQTAISRMEEFRRIRAEETKMLMWWRELSPCVHKDFAKPIFGRGWCWDATTTQELMLQQDYPPSGRCKDGWLRWVIAMKARNQFLPPNFPVPSQAELFNIGVDGEQDEEALDVMVTRAGTIPEQDPFLMYRKPSRLRPVRQLVLQGWHAKPQARDRTLQWLAAAKPEPQKMHWFTYVTISACIALVRWIHPTGSIPKVRQKLIDVLRYRQKEAAHFKDDHAVAAQVWLEQFLANREPFPA